MITVTKTNKMKKNNLIDKSRVLLKPLFITCFLLFIQVAVSKAQVPYAQLTFNYDHTDYSTIYWNVGVFFYEDQFDVTSVADPNVPMNIRTIYRKNCGTPVIQEYTGVSVSDINAGYFGIPYVNDVYNYDTHQMDHIAFWLELTPGTGYQLGVENYIGGPYDFNSCY